MENSNNLPSAITPEGIIAEAQNLLDQSPPDHSEILDQLLEKVQRIDFNQLASSRDDEEVTLWKLRVICINEILRLAKIHRWGICKHKEFTYLYNGAFWGHLETDVLMTFLGKAAHRMGIPQLRSQDYEFKEKLLKQFNTSAIMPAPVNNTQNTYINLLNGTLEIGPKGSQLRAFDRNDFLTYQLPFKFDVKAKAPEFQTFLDEVLPFNELQCILSEYIGYLFIPNRQLKMEKTLLLYGVGANGKSVFFDIVNALLGRNNISTYSLSNLTNDNGYYRAMLGNKLVNYASEISRRLNTSFFKQLVSGEPIEARLPYGKPFILENYAKLIFNTNELPIDVEHTNAYFRRFIIIPFSRIIPEEQQDKTLALRINESELPGVLNWVLEGLKRLTHHGVFTHSDIVQEQIREYKQEADTTYLFIEENNFVPDAEAYQTLKDLYGSYKVFCSENNYRPLSNRSFKKRLEAHQFYSKKMRMGQVIFCKYDADAYME